MVAGRAKARCRWWRKSRSTRWRRRSRGPTTMPLQCCLRASHKSRSPQQRAPRRAVRGAHETQPRLDSSRDTPAYVGARPTRTLGSAGRVSPGQGRTPKQGDAEKRDRRFVRGDSEEGRGYPTSGTEPTSVPSREETSRSMFRVQRLSGSKLRNPARQQGRHLTPRLSGRVAPGSRCRAAGAAPATAGRPSRSRNPRHQP